MTVYGTDAIERAAEQGTSLRVAAHDLVTPLAWEFAASRGVEIVTATASEASPARSETMGFSAASAPALAPSSPHSAGLETSTGPAVQTGFGAAPSAPLRPPSPALFRRGAPLDEAVKPNHDDPQWPRSSSGRAGRVVVIGAGHVGMITAMRLAEADVIDEVVLVDIVEGLAAGIALDLVHTAPLVGFRTQVRGVTTIEDAGEADYVVITAGRPRQPGMSRSDLVATNANIVGDMARRAAIISPDAVLIVVTNPLDEMTQHAWQVSGFPDHRVLGMAGVLDSARFRALVGLDSSARTDQIDGVALGSHGEEMVLPLSQASARGRRLDDQVPAEQLGEIVERARNSGAEVVGLLKSGSAFLAPGTSAAHMVLAMVRGSREILPATVLATGQYGITDVFVGLPTRLGPQGVEEIVEVPLDPHEREALRAAAARISERVSSLPDPTVGVS